MANSAVLFLAGRLALVAIFLLAGLNKISAYEGTAGWMESMGVPGVMLPLVIALELGAGLAIAFGLFTRLAALAIAGFSVASALIFHLDFNDQIQFLMFWKNIAIAGGFLVLAAAGAGNLSLDARRQQEV